MKGPKSDDVFDVLAKVDTLNLYDDSSDTYRQGAVTEYYKLLLSHISTLHNINPQDIETAMDKIAWHESRGRSGAIQKSHKLDASGNKMRDAQGNYVFIDGPGRGLFQYEVSSAGGSGAGNTAFRRLYNFIGGDLVKGQRPDNLFPFMSQYLPENKWGHHDMSIPGSEVDVDFSKLTEIEQKALFLTDKLKEGIDFSDIGTDTAQWWLDHHKKAPGTTDPFNESMKSYKP